MNKFWSRKELAYIGLWSLSLTLAQVLLAFILGSLSVGFKESYTHFNQWDSYHYIDIVDRGYQIPPGELTSTDVHSNRANVGYFPAYPILAKGLQKITGGSTRLSLLVTSQFFCFLFWLQFLLLCQIYRFSVPWTKRGVFSLAVFPASFFMVMGYSESLFNASLIGMILWTEVWLSRTQGKKINGAFFLAGGSGMILTATRLVGIPLILYPVIRRLSLQKKPELMSVFDHKGWRTILLMLLSGLGGFGFFYWCHLQFGQWNIYFKLQQLGWGNHPNFFAILDPRSYIPKLFLEDTMVSVCRVSNFFIFSLFWGLFYQEWKTKKGIHRDRWALYFAAWSMFYISLSGKANANMDSMVRYNQPVFVILVLIITKVLIEKRPAFTLQPFSRWLLSLGYFLAIIFQLWMTFLFIKGGWVA